MESLKLGARPLTLEEVWQVAVENRRVELSPAAVRKIKRAHDFLMEATETDEVHYGINTGFGIFSSVKIAHAELETLQYNILRSHAVGIGPYLPDVYVRGMLLLRAAALAIGNSGVSLPLVEQILALLNRGVHPLIPEQGSVGASGDLAPLAHLSLVLIGEGRARVKGKELSGSQALRAAGLKPIRLGPKEGLALINGTQFMTAIGTIALLEAEHLADIADLAGAMTVEAVRGTVLAFEPEIQAVRPHPGQIHTARRLRAILGSGGGKSQIAKSHEGCGKVQDPYSLRCMPQVHGASRDMMRFVREVLEREVNAVTDNPLIFPESGKILSGGNFHGEIVSMAMDMLCIATAELASISEQRLEKLINPSMSDLPVHLTRNGGLNSGFMMVQVAAASIVSENKTLCHPASVDSIPTNVDKEDHVSMGAWASRKASRVVENSRRVLAMELLAAAQGIDLLRPLQSSAIIEKAHKVIRKRSPKLDLDRALHDDMVYVERLIAERALDFKLKE